MPNIITAPPTVANIAYTATELLKIRISGVMLAIAVLILTYILYTYIMHRKKNWEIRKAVEEMDDNHIAYDPEDYQQVPFKVNKKLIYVFAFLMMAVGLVLTLM